jgi:hypothetical protein
MMSSKTLTTMMTSGLFNNLTLISGKAMQVWADYDGAASQISVSLAPMGATKPVWPLLSAPYNLSSNLRDPSFIGHNSCN